MISADAQRYTDTKRHRKCKVILGPVGCMHHGRLVKINFQLLIMA